MSKTAQLLALAEVATPGPWIAKDVSGAGLEIHMKHPRYPDKTWPAFGTGAAYIKRGLVAYETWVQFPTEELNVAQARNAAFIAAANPETIKQMCLREQKLVELVRLQHDALEEFRSMSACDEAIEAFNTWENGK